MGQARSVASDAGSFTLEIRIRGKADHLHQETCEGLEHAIQIGEKWFRAFQARNPWFVQDSKRKRIFILLDPDTEALDSAKHGRNPV
jgi:hypothetical protein